VNGSVVYLGGRDAGRKEKQKEDFFSDVDNPPHNAESKANFNFEAKGSVLVQNYVIYPLKTLSFNLGHSKINSSAITS
jgi:hypothetical protein